MLDLTKVLCCPQCSHALDCGHERASCTACGSLFPIIGGVLLLKQSLPADIDHLVALADQRVEYDNNKFSPFNDSVEFDTYRECMGLERAIILELGAGTGRVSLELLRRNPDSVFVFSDVSLPMLLYMKRKLEALGIDGCYYLICIDKDEYPFVSGAFDAVYALEVVEHLARRSRAALYEAVGRLLRRNGLFVLSVFNYSIYERLFGKRESFDESRIPLEEDWYYYRFTGSEIRREITAGGFDVTRITHIRSIPGRSVVDKLPFGITTRFFLLLEQLLKRSGVSRFLGHLIVLQCQVPQ